jgi:HEAT repeat protein
MKMTDCDPILQLLRTFAIRHYPQRVDDFLDALTAFQGDHIAALIEALADQDDEVRLLAVEVLYSMDKEAEPALSALIDTLDDPDRIVRVAAVAPVADFGRKAIAAIPTLESWLYGGDEFSEVTAAAAIIQIDPSRADDVLPVIINALKSDDVGIRCHAAWHLGQLGTIARDAVPELRRLLDEEPIRSFVVDAIASITGEV